MMINFRFVHISDLHIGEMPNQVNFPLFVKENRNTPFSDASFLKTLSYDKSILELNSHDETALAFATAFCYDRRDNVDAFVFTGDLSRTGKQKDILATASIFNKKVKKYFFNSSSEFSFSRVIDKTLIVPGNHDRYQNNLGEVNGYLFDQHFGEFVPASKRAWSSIIEKDGKSLGLVFADFSFTDKSQVDGWKHQLGGGYADPSIIKEVEDLTDKLRFESPGCVILWLNHFAPFECGSELSLKDYKKYLDSARKKRVSLILCGHTHEKSHSSVGDTLILCAGSATCTDSVFNHYIHLIDLKIGKKSNISRENYLFDENKKDYFISDVEKFELYV